MNILYNPKLLESENEYQYIWRLGQAKDSGILDLDWNQIAKLINVEFRTDETEYRNESAYRKIYQYTKKMYEAGVFNHLDEDKYFKELQIQKDELYKIKRQVSDQRREYNKLLVSDARSENLVEKLIESANRLNEERPLDFTSYVDSIDTKEGVVFCADWHYGMVTNNIWNQYNTDICKKRVVKFTNKVREYLSLNKIGKVHIVLLGDAAHGAIHSSCRVASEEDTCDQLMHVSEIIADMIEEISKSVNEIVVHSCYGNHLRTIQDKMDSVHSDNMEKIIPWWLNQRLQKNTKVSIVESEFKEFTKLNVLGYNICCVHGDIDSFKNLGVTVNTIFSRLYGETIDYTVSADKHHLEEFEAFDIENVLVRSLCGTDDYANGKRLYSKAGQTLMIFNNEDGRESTYNIKLN